MYRQDELSRYTKAIRRRDPELEKELDEMLSKARKPPWAEEARAVLEGMSWLSSGSGVPDEVAPPANLEAETIVLRMGRPVLNILDGDAVLDFQDVASQTWQRRLHNSSAAIAPVIRAVGRVEVGNHPSGLDYMGTGWVIDDGVIVTNRHVAETFAAYRDEEFRFLTGFDRKNPIGVNMDFLEEVGNPRQQPLKVSRVLYIAKETEADVAFLELEPATRSSNPKPVRLSGELTPVDTMIAVAGYPARDGRIPDAALMDRIYGKVYDKKRLAPGYVTGFERATLVHDCTTLGGNSGSPLIDLATGEMCGLHFSGSFLRGNYAVPSLTLKRMLADLQAGLNRIRTQTGSTPRSTTVSHENETKGPPQDITLRVTVPLEITVRLGSVQIRIDAGGIKSEDDSAGDGGSAVSPGAAPSNAALPSPDETSLANALAEAKRLYGQRRDVYAIEAGWEFSDGWITRRRAVVFAVKSRLNPDQLKSQGILPLPKDILGVPVDVRVATLEETAPEHFLEARGQGWTSTYERLPEESDLLRELADESMTVTLHASPDAGWAVLSEFLARTTQTLTVGMYDFTAPHIVEAINRATGPSRRKLSLVLQRGEDLGKGTKVDDLPEEETVADLADRLKARFDYSWAAIRGAASPFKSAYHIKVAVRDHSAFWLSSGNWQSSNQPRADPLSDRGSAQQLIQTHNREWHVVVENESLAKTFERYLMHDLVQAKQAVREARLASEAMVWVPEGLFQPSMAELEARPTYFAPRVIKDKKLRVQPLLTPDNYAWRVLELVESARQRLFFQNQSLSILESNPEHYERLLASLLAKQRGGLDVRVIIRNIGDVRKTVSRIRDYGFDTDRLRLQTNCHTKGIVVDGQAVLMGSHNWTGDGTGFNRDASLIFYDPEVAEYYEQLFLYDWNRVGPPRIDESLPAVELVDPADPTPRPGMLLMPLERWLGES